VLLSDVIDKGIEPEAAWIEQDRLKALRSYEILDTPREEDFDDIVKMASQICNMPVSLVSFVADNRQWFKAKVGVTLDETPLDVSICKQAILQPGLFVVPDTTKDDRFNCNPLVTGEPHLRFYAGAVLETPEGLPLGTLCVLDYKPRVLTEQESFTLKALARQVMTQLELRRALRAKTHSEERLTLALDSSGFVGTWDWDLVTDRVYADPRFVSIFGGEASWSSEGASITEYTKAIHSEDLERIKARIEGVLKSGGVFQEEYRITQKDGSVRWIEARGKCRLDQEGRPVRLPGVAVDITDRKLVEQVIRDAADRFHFMAESMPQKIFTAKLDGSIDFFNQQWIEFTGLSFEQIRDWGWAQFIHPDDLEYTVRQWREAVTTVKPFESEQRFRRKDGVYRWHLSRAHPMHNARGELVMWIGSNTDIDDQRRASEILERTVVEKTAELRASIEELEAFSYSISHDMRAPLRAMLGFSDILQEEYGSKLDEQGNRYLNRIRSASARMDDLIQDVLTLTQMSRAEIVLERIDAGKLVREIAETYPNLSTGKIDIEIREQLPVVMANEAALTQCVSNILGNAVKFVAAGTKPRVIIWAERYEGRIQLWFQDNGIGIAEENFGKIFEIFHRLDRQHDGTGIGLAIVKKATERMGGRVGLESKPGAGTAFWVELQGP